ncbi:glyoxalase [Arthrobacter sp. MYb227]|uniref:VOC family protein n=1 Tax=Arthrobacter sp. MYb227 TaxID=1848601 RepID=UPI000CFB9067|nr:glyoxalase [Arthrobacter sp. MYb227]
MLPSGSGRLHHTELWVRDFARSQSTIGWLLAQLGYVPGEPWSTGISYQGAHSYIVLESGPDVLDTPHQRLAPGLNHLAFHAGSQGNVDAITKVALTRGFTLMFEDKHPFAGGPMHYAAYLVDSEGFEFELVAG